jgi:hypothetical protein
VLEVRLMALENDSESVVRHEVTIGEFTLKQKDYAERFWIYNSSGEGTELSAESQLALAEVIRKFFQENM